MRLKTRHQKKLSIGHINTSYNHISLDHIFKDVDPLSEWLHEKENPLLDGENAGVFLVDTSDDEINSGNGPNDGDLSPINDDDRQNGDGGEIRSSSRYEGDYGVGSISRHFCDRSEFDENMYSTPRRDRSEPRAPSRKKDTRKNISEAYSFDRRSSSTNHGYINSSTSTQGFYPPRPHESSQDHSESTSKKSDYPRHSTNW
ncbi:hypothetical protein HRI_000707800 [Hibiscus trionum]|uniref:Uncharacterized protein n=1 Tax=Hibiscus trionum TaxID=183268 RepID=A0A9W7LP56_HIBTR|nr:hypothetical protein HRI_000707800 [Hibiscus trionum]